MVADTLIYHPTFIKLLKFLNTTPKKEKCFRLVSYLSRFLSYYLQRQGFSKETVNKFKDLREHATMIRKGMRFLKPLNHLETAAKTYDNKLVDNVLQCTTVIRNLSLAIYFSLDTITWFKMLGLVDKKKYKLVPTWATRFWGIGLLAGIANSVRAYRINVAKLSAADEKTDTDALAKKIYQNKRKMVWDLLDLFICLNSLKYLHFTEGDVGCAGVITSVMGLKDMWAAT